MGGSGGSDSLPGALVCPTCGRRDPPVLQPKLCSTCGEPFWYEPPEQVCAHGSGGDHPYAALLPPAPPILLGEGHTPLLRSQWLGPQLGLDLWYKYEGGNPTGSFKDRGASVLVSTLQAMGAKAVADDSSGNAGAALAAYAARAGLKATLFVPDHASPRKLAQIEAYGAKLNRVRGPRYRCEEAVKEACQEDNQLIYASHNLSPYFVEGLATVAYELCEDIPTMGEEWHVVLPVGGGGLLVGMARGFSRRERMPRLHMAQPKACAPLTNAILEHSPVPAEVDPLPTAAEGASIPRPHRGRQALSAVRVSGGTAVAVSEEGIHEAQKGLAQGEGILIEPTSALAPAAVPQLMSAGTLPVGSRVVVVLTGTGLKAL